jgi:threonine dehydratase
MDLVQEIRQAASRIAPHILNTPLLHSPYLSELNGGKVYLKLESEQFTGSFKARGALNRILAATDAERRRGFITASTGNHGQGFAYALSVSGDSGKIFLPVSADASKVEALGYYDVELVLLDASSLDTELQAKRYSAEHGATWVSPYNDWLVIAGQGTMAVEITDLVTPDIVMGCVGGGGMMGGVSAWCKHRVPEAKVIGCLPENSPEMFVSVQQGRIVEMESQDTLSDGSAGGVEPGAVTFDLCRENIDSFALASEQQIADAIRFMVEKHHKIVEGSAGVTIASFCEMASRLEGRTVVLIVCGANISVENLRAIL